MIYIFTTRVKRQEQQFDRSCRDDLTARNLAKSNTSVVKVETEQGRVVYRKPMTAAELAHAMKKQA